MRIPAGWVVWILALGTVAAAQGRNGAEKLPDAAQLVRETVYNELHDHETHGYWRYWIARRIGRETELQAQVETGAGPMTFAMAANGRALTGAAAAEENERIQHLLRSPGEQAEHRKAYFEDERRIGRILALLPEAFVYEPTEVEGGNYHLRFHPNPNYPAHTIESRIFHAMGGELWISVRAKHLVRLDGRLQENVDFGFGILGRLYKDGWFRLERTEVGHDWKTERLEVHMAGRAMLFKTIGRETSEMRGGFQAVPAGLTLEQAAALVRQAGSGQVVVPAVWVGGR